MTPCFPLRLTRTTTGFTCSQALCPRKLQTRDKNRFYIFYMLCTYAHAHTYFEQNGQKHTTHALWTVNMSVSGAELTAGEAASSTTEALGGWADRRTDGRLGVGRRVLDVVSDCDCASLCGSRLTASSQHVAWSRVLPAAASRPFSSSTGWTFL